MRGSSWPLLRWIALLRIRLLLRRDGRWCPRLGLLDLAAERARHLHPQLRDLLSEREDHVRAHGELSSLRRSSRVPFRERETCSGIDEAPPRRATELEGRLEMRD